MICINCFHDKTTTKNSRKHTKHPSVWRRRACPECGAVFTTYERATLDGRMVLTHDGSTTPFNLGKLIISISRSFQHNKHTAAHDSYFLAQTVQEQIIKQGKPLSTQIIAQITHMILLRPGSGTPVRRPAPTHHFSATREAFDRLRTVAFLRALIAAVAFSVTSNLSRYRPTNRRVCAVNAAAEL